MNRNRSYLDSDIFQYLLIYPTHALLFALALLIPIYPPLVHKLFAVLSIFTVAILSMNLMARRYPLMSLLISGDIFLLFIAIIVLAGAPDRQFNWHLLPTIYWIFACYFLTYAFRLVPGLNTRVYLLILSATAAALLPVLYPLTNLDIGSAIELPQLLHSLFDNQQLFSFLSAQTLGFPVAILILNYRLSRLWNGITWASCIALLLTIFLTAELTGAVMAALVFVCCYFLLRRVSFLGIALVILLSFTYFGNRLNSPIFNRPNQVTKEADQLQRRQILRANVRMFQSHPWLGVGYEKNKELLRTHLEPPVEIPPSPAPNTYFQILATTGIFGFLCFMGFFLSFLFKTLKLWQEIPKSHLWHKSFVLGALSSQVVFHGAGLYLWTFGEPSMVYPFVFSLTIIAVLSGKYSSGIVSDDYSI